MASKKKSSSRRVLVMCPFAVVKPDDVTLEDINARLLRRYPVGEPAAAAGVHKRRQGMPGLSGKAVVAATRIRTGGRGTITIIRTKERLFWGALHLHNKVAPFLSNLWHHYYLCPVHGKKQRSQIRRAISLQSKHLKNSYQNIEKQSHQQTVVCSFNLSCMSYVHYKRIINCSSSSSSSSSCSSSFLAVPFQSPKVSVPEQIIAILVKSNLGMNH